MDKLNYPRAATGRCPILEIFMPSTNICHAGLGRMVSTLISKRLWSLLRRRVNRRASELLIEAKPPLANQPRVLSRRVKLAHLKLKWMVSVETQKFVANLQLVTNREHHELNESRLCSEVASCDAKNGHDVGSAQLELS